jgi:hypothetical protein
MHTRTALLTASLASLALAAPSLHAGDCSASATFKQVTKEAKSAAKPGAKPAGKIPVTASTYSVQFEVEVEGCPDSPGRHSKFAGPAYGTVTYTFKKTYLDRSTVEGKETANWNAGDKRLTVSGKIDGQDAKGIFEAGDVKVERTVCGCR